jgi:hypothetical protein
LCSNCNSVEEGDKGSPIPNGNDIKSDFFLDPLFIDTNIVKRIGLDIEVNSIVVEINEHLINQTIHLEDFAERTIKPLKKQISELLVDQDSKSKQSIINSIVTCVNRNVDLIKNRCCRDSIDDEEESKFEANDAQLLVSFATLKENSELFFKNQYGEPYVAVRLGNKDNKHLEIMPLQSSRYKYYLSRLFRENTVGQVIGKDAINNAVNLLAANAEFDGQSIPLHLRVAWGHTANRGTKIDSIYYDMTDPEWRIIEISNAGWQIINGNDANVPIVFKRHNQIVQVEPDRKYGPDIFEQFLNLTNIKNNKHRQLVKVYIASLFIPDIDHAILTLYGSKGAAKSFLLELIKKLVDPSRPVLLTLLKNMEEFIQQVNHNYLAFYDNVKYIPYWLSDEICKSVTGIGHTKRKKYTDDEDIIYEHRRCISLNGINVALVEPDALDRSIFVELPDISDENRKKEEVLLAEFENIKPKALAYIFDIIVKAIQIKPSLNLTELSRMADFAEWGEAISRAMGYSPMSFIQVYNENRNEQNIVAVNENIVGSVLVKFYREYEHRHPENPRFIGSPEELYAELVNFAENNTINIRTQQFPKAPNILVNKINTIRPNLKVAFGIVIEITRDATENTSVITIYRNNNKRASEPTNNTNPVLNHYYHLQVHNKHIQNYNNSISLVAPYIKEVTSSSESPKIQQNNNVLSLTGGSEATDVSSLL